MHHALRLTLTASLLCLATPALAALKVAATVPDLAALARAVGGERVHVVALSLPTQDPHFVDARPSLALELNRADLLLAVGLGLESGWLPTLQTGARNARILSGASGYLEASRFVQLLDVPAAGLDRSQGDIHPGGNPHFLYDPRAALAVARGIAERLGELDPPGAAAYQANLERFSAELEAARRRWEARLAPLRGQPVVAYHRTTSYLAAWLGLEPVAFLEPKPGIPPSPSHVAQVLALARQRAVRLVLIEEYYPATAARLLAQKAPARLVVLPGGADVRAGETYIQNMDQRVEALAQASLAGKEG